MHGGAKGWDEGSSRYANAEQHLHLLNTTPTYEQNPKANFLPQAPPTNWRKQNKNKSQRFAQQSIDRTVTATAAAANTTTTTYRGGGEGENRSKKSAANNIQVPAAEPRMAVLQDSTVRKQNLYVLDEDLEVEHSSVKQFLEDDSPLFDAGFTPSSFQYRYQRNNKRGGLKNLRCFPHCAAEHKERGFCGRPVIVSLSGSAKAKYLRKSGDASLDNGTAHQHAILCWAQFLPAGETFGLNIGTQLPLSAILALERTRENPLRPWMRGRRLEKSDVVAQATLDGSKVEPKQLGADDYFGFNMENKGWHYGWASNKHSCNAEHCLHVFIFKLVSPAATAVVDPESVLLLQERLQKISSPSVHTNTKRNGKGELRNQNSPADTPDNNSSSNGAQATTTGTSSTSSTLINPTSQPVLYPNIIKTEELTTSTNTSKRTRSRHNSTSTSISPIISILEELGIDGTTDISNVVLECVASAQSPQFQLFCRRRRRFSLDRAPPMPEPSLRPVKLSPESALTGSRTPSEVSLVAAQNQSPEENSTNETLRFSDQGGTSPNLLPRQQVNAHAELKSRQPGYSQNVNEQIFRHSSSSAPSYSATRHARDTENQNKSEDFRKQLQQIPVASLDNLRKLVGQEIEEQISQLQILHQLVLQSPDIQSPTQAHRALQDLSKSETGNPMWDQLHKLSEDQLRLVLAQCILNATASWPASSNASTMPTVIAPGDKLNQLRQSTANSSVTGSSALDEAALPSVSLGDPKRKRDDTKSRAHAQVMKQQHGIESPSTSQNQLYSELLARLQQPDPLSLFSSLHEAPASLLRLTAAVGDASEVLSRWTSINPRSSISNSIEEPQSFTSARSLSEGGNDSLGYAVLQGLPGGQGASSNSHRGAQQCSLRNIDNSKTLNINQTARGGLETGDDVLRKTSLDDNNEDDENSSKDSTSSPVNKRVHRGTFDETVESSGSNQPGSEMDGENDSNWDDGNDRTADPSSDLLRFANQEKNDDDDDDDDDDDPIGLLLRISGQVRR